MRNKLQFNIAVLCLVEIQGDQTTMICSKYPSRNGGDFFNNSAESLWSMVLIWVLTIKGISLVTQIHNIPSIWKTNIVRILKRLSIWQHVLISRLTVQYFHSMAWNRSSEMSIVNLVILLCHEHKKYIWETLVGIHSIMALFVNV